MGKSQSVDRVLEAVVVSIDVAQASRKNATEWTVYGERPGRLGRFSRSWSNVSGVLDAAQIQDLATWVAKTVENAVVVWGGVKGVLDQEQSR